MENNWMIRFEYLEGFLKRWFALDFSFLRDLDADQIRRGGLKGPANMWLTPTEVAKICGVNTNTIYRWIKSGKLPANRISRKTIKIHVSHVTKLMGGGEVHGSQGDRDQVSAGDQVSAE